MRYACFMVDSTVDGLALPNRTVINSTQYSPKSVEIDSFNDSRGPSCFRFGVGRQRRYYVRDTVLHWIYSHFEDTRQALEVKTWVNINLQRRGASALQRMEQSVGALSSQSSYWHK